MINNSRPLPQIATMIDVGKGILHRNAHHRCFVPHSTMVGRTRFFVHTYIEQAVRPALTRPTCFTQIVHARPDKATGKEVVFGNQTPWIERRIASQIALGTAIVRKLLRNKEATIRKFLVIADSPCFKIVISYDISHPCKCFLVIILGSKGNLPTRF